MKNLELKKPLYTQCSVCRTIEINGVGSSCCGGAWEYMYEHEVEALGVDPRNTRNLGVK